MIEAYEIVSAWVMKQIEHNDIFAGLVGASVVGPLLYLLRRVPGNVWDLLVDQFTVKVVINNDDDAFEGITTWLAQTKYAAKARRTKLSSTYQDGQDIWTIAPGYGKHYVWHNKRLIVLQRETTEKSQSFRVSENISMTTIGRRQDFLRSVIEEAERLRTKPTAGFAAMIWNDWWESVGHKPERPLESVILPDGQIERMLEDIKTFQDRRNWYVQMGVPYRRGYMFSGAPGTGKSSVIAALACKLEMSVYLINLGMVSSDNSLISAFARVPSNAILVIEDVDAFSASKKRRRARPVGDDSDEPVSEQKGVSLSGLLNAIDGIVASEGRIMIMTTNHPDKLDPALIRPGRVDLHERFELFGLKEMGKMFTRFYGTQIPILEKPEPIAAAELQNLMMIHTPETLIPM